MLRALSSRNQRLLRVSSTTVRFKQPILLVQQQHSTTCRFYHQSTWLRSDVQQQQGQQQASNESTTTASPQSTPEQQVAPKSRAKKLLRLFLYVTGVYLILKLVIYIIVVSEDNAFVMNNTATSLFKKLPLNALSRAWGWVYSTYVPEFARPLFYRIYALMFDANVDECEKDLKQYESLQAFFTRKLKPNARTIHEQDDIVSPVDGRVMSCGVVHIQKSEHENVDVMIEQVKGLNYPLHHFLGYDMKDALLALEQAAEDVAEESTDGTVNKVTTLDQFLKGKDEKKLHYCVLYLAPGDYHRYHSPCDWRVHDRKHISGYLFPVMPLFVKTMRGLFALNERVVLNGQWKHGDFHYVLVGATNVGSMVLYFDNTLNTNLKRERKRQPKKPKKEESKKEEAKQEEETKVEVEPENGYDKYLEMKAREYVKGGIHLEKGEDIGYFRMGSTVVMLFEHDDPNFKFGIKPGDRVLLGEPLSQQYRSTAATENK
jgi:phosphatidylserine decarboxylase